MDQRRNRIWPVLFGLYSALMLWLLFDRPGYLPGIPYWEQLRANLNLVPFRTIRLYIRLLTRIPDSRYIPHAIINLLGNVVMFIPLGLLLPRVFKKLNKFLRVMLATALIVTAVELLQLFTLVGSLDIDDLLLNLLGAALGYWLHRAFSQ